MAKFQLTKTEQGKYRFHLLGTNDSLLAESEIYESKDSAENGIASVKKNATTDRYQVKPDQGGGYYASLKATNGQVIAHSRGHENEASAKKVVEIIRQTAPNADVVDLT